MVSYTTQAQNNKQSLNIEIWSLPPQGEADLLFEFWLLSFWIFCSSSSVVQEENNKESEKKNAVIFIFINASTHVKLMLYF